MDCVYIQCAECPDFGTDSRKEMVNHILTVHTGYSIDEAEEYAKIWEDDARELAEVDNLYMERPSNEDDF